MGNLECVWEIQATLGEGPLWVARENSVYWVDILSKQIHRYGLLDGSKRSWTFETAITSLAARENGGFVCTTRDGFAFLDLPSGKLKAIVQPEKHLLDNRFNDGKVDGNGRYWAGTMNEDEIGATGNLYRLDGNLTLHKMDTAYRITNGPAFSVDGQTMYHTDSSKRTVYAFDLHDDGAISNKRNFVKLETKEEGFPDGMTVDSENCIWLCHFAGSRITRYSPQGEVLEVIRMPVTDVTSCTFAGPNLDTLFITTARFLASEEEKRRYPLAGSLFAYKPGVTGLPTPLFAG